MKRATRFSLLVQGLEIGSQTVTAEKFFLVVGTKIFH